MYSMETNVASGQYVREVARKFVSLYYRVMNHYSSFLHHFYGSDSTVVVCDTKEDGQPITTKAENTTTVRELLRTLYDGVHVDVRSCTPQQSSNGCLSILITGVMTHENSSEEKAFTQALILTRQRDGYYVRTDTVLVLPLSSCPVASSSLLASCCATNDIASTSVEGNALQRHVMEHPQAKGLKHGLLAVQTRIPSIELPSGPALIPTGQGTPSRLNGSKYDTTTIVPPKGTYVLDQRARELLSARGQPLDGSDASMSALQGCHLLPDGTQNGIAYNGALAMPSSADGLTIDLSQVHHQPWPSHKSSPIGQQETPQRTPTDILTLFVCKLPMRSTIEAVTDAFAKFGPLAKDEPVRVFTGVNHCYARVTYANEQGAQAAMNAEIYFGANQAVTEYWRPRERRQRRRRTDSTAEQHVAAAN